MNGFLTYLPDKFVMNCRSESDAVEFLKHLHYFESKPLFVTTRWGLHKENSCYDFVKDKVGSIDYYEKHGYVILDFERNYKQSVVDLNLIYERVVNSKVDSFGYNNILYYV